MLSIIDILATITSEQAAGTLDKGQEIDPTAGIIIAKLDSVPGVEANGQHYDVYAARVLPATNDNPNYVSPHYHLRGEEPYRFLRGVNGEMNSGVVDGVLVRWSEPRLVQPGDIYIVREGEVHSFRNLGTDPYDFAFACPVSHLVDYDAERTPDGDRYLTRVLANGIPPWYPSSSS